MSHDDKSVRPDGPFTIDGKLYYQNGRHVFSCTCITGEYAEEVVSIFARPSIERIKELELENRSLLEANERLLDPEVRRLSALSHVAAPTLHVTCGRMQESNGRVTWAVFVGKSADEKPWDCHEFYSSASEGRAQYEAARLKHFLGQGPKPDILTFDTDLPPEPVSATLPPREPTKEMLAAGNDCKGMEQINGWIAEMQLARGRKPNWSNEDPPLAQAWRAMYDAAMDGRAEETGRG